jgi:hypothetical protein
VPLGVSPVTAKQSESNEVQRKPLWRRVIGVSWFALLIPLIIPFFAAQFLGNLLTNTFFPGSESYSGPPQILRLGVGCFVVTIIAGFLILWLLHVE